MAAASTLTTLDRKQQASQPVTDPTYLFDLAERMHAIEMLSAAVGPIGLFEFLAAEPKNLDAICSELNLARRPALVLLTMLSAQELLSRDRAGFYSLTQTAREYLVSDSPWSLAPCFDALTNRPSCQAILGVLRSGLPMGGPPNGDAAPPNGAAANGAGEAASGAPSDWNTGMQEEAFAEFFLNAIDSRNAYLAQVAAGALDLRSCKSLLDIGGGSGIYACAFAKSNEHLQATVLEKPPVDAIATRAIARRGLASRVSVLSSDMMSAALPRGFDTHLFSNVIHDWDEETVLRLLRSSFEALAGGGRIIIHDVVLNTEADRRPATEYSALLVSFTAGRCYALEELRDLLHQAGFEFVTYTPTAIHRSLVVACKPNS